MLMSNTSPCLGTALQPALGRSQGAAASSDSFVHTEGHVFPLRLPALDETRAPRPNPDLLSEFLSEDGPVCAVLFRCRTLASTGAPLSAPRQASVAPSPTAPRLLRDGPTAGQSRHCSGICCEFWWERRLLEMLLRNCHRRSAFWPGQSSGLSLSSGTAGRAGGRTRREFVWHSLKIHISSKTLLATSILRWIASRSRERCLLCTEQGTNAVRGPA